MMPAAIGGYFGLVCPPQPQPFRPTAHRFQSARAAFHALLQAGQPRRVWMPSYTCDALFTPLAALNIEAVVYELTAAFAVPDTVKLAADDWLVYVNYFGVCHAQEQALLRRFSPMQLVFDRTQALFAPPHASLAAIYSPRKFFGVPDGGLLDTALPLTLPDAVDTGSVARCTHLLRRRDAGAEAGYADFQRAESSLENSQPLRMSALSAALLDSQDTDLARRQRTENFACLHRALGQANTFPLDLAAIEGAMCYPFLSADPTLRQRLLTARIFVPRYWPEVAERATPNSPAQHWVAQCLPLPCDQRYGAAEMARIVSVVLEAVHGLASEGAAKTK